MTGRSLDDQERAALCDLLDELGPAAPTLLAGWTTLDLAAHLVLREHDLRAAPGLVVPGAWSRYAERRRLAMTRTQGYGSLVATVRSGPPPGFFRIGWVRSLANLNELFVHHEDVRRADGRGPRTLSPALDTALWRNVGRSGRLLGRRVRGVGVELVWSATAEQHTLRSGTPTARVIGPPGELLLFLFGRGDAAQVEISGPPDAVATVRAARFGM